MARQSKKISALEVARLMKKGKYPIGEGLYLQISRSGAKSWVFRYSMNKKTTWMGLGSYSVVTLAEARAKTLALRKTLSDGVNPLVRKNQIEQAQRFDEAKLITFDECASQYIAAHKSGWTNIKHISQWENTLKTFVSPVFGNVSIQDVDTSLVMRVLEPIWTSKNETADRIRGRVERIIGWATVKKYRTGDNPARWRGHLDNLLAQRKKVRKVKHHSALSFEDLSDFMVSLRKIDSVSSLALEFTILTATRTSEALNAKWEEFNLADRYWLIPAERMKAGEAHKVPLSDRSIEILKHLETRAFNEFVFPGKKKFKPLSNMAMLQIIRRLGHGVTTHGFRSTFRDWAAERTYFANEVVEKALAHTIPNKVEAAYRRGDLFDKRRKLMTAWAEYCQSSQRKNRVLEMPNLVTTIAR